MFERIVINNGVKIQYKIKEDKGKTLLFLHGGGGSLTAWEIILPLFRDKNYSLITVDLRGHGLSDRPSDIKDYALEKHAEDILRILEQEKLEKMVLVGHCLGSMVAATFASTYPLRVEKLILINTNYELPWFIIHIPVRQLWYLTLHMLKYLFPYKAKPSKGVDYFQFVGTPDIDFNRLYRDLRVMGIFSVVRQALALLSWQGKKYFSRISVPTLVIAGTYDLVYPNGTGERAVKLVSNAKLEYVDSNHISVINNPAGVYDKIVKFLQTT